MEGYKQNLEMANYHNDKKGFMEILDDINLVSSWKAFDELIEFSETVNYEWTQEWLNS